MDAIATGRLMPPTDAVFRRVEDVRPETLRTVEGVAMAPDAVVLQVMMVTPEMEMLRIFRRKGFKDPVHRHDDHATVATLVSGRALVTVGGETFLAEPGAVWHHPRGVDHATEALEDCIQVEVKSPPCRTW